MSMSVTIKLKKDVVELAEKMVKLGIAKSRSHAINMMIERGIKEVRKEVEFWENVYAGVEELKKSGFVVSHGKLSELLYEERAER